MRGCGKKFGDGASDGTRTHGIQDHNLALYHLSYARHPRGRVVADHPVPVNSRLLARDAPPFSLPSCHARSRTRANPATLP
jgi:hypothetical protein